MILFAFGVVKSYHLELSNYNFYGGILRDFILLIFTGVLTVFLPVKRKTLKLYVKDNPKRIYRVLKIFSCISFLVCSYLCYLIYTKYGFNFFYNAITSTIRYDEEIVKQFPFLAFSMLPFVSVILNILSFQQRKNIHFLLLNIFCSLLYCFVFSARIFVIQFLVYGLAIWIRAKCFEKTIKVSYCIFIGGVVLLFLILTASFRDYDTSGHNFTDNRYFWGMATINDYFLSCSIYSSNFLNYKNDQFDLSYYIPVLERFFTFEHKDLTKVFNFKDQYGYAAYTNLSTWIHITEFGFFHGLILLSLYVMLLYQVWNLYAQGHLAGYLFYPLILYSLLEFWRIPYLLEEIVQILAVILLFVYFYIRKDCFYEDSCDTMKVP